jgi:hypothetical protein
MLTIYGHKIPICNYADVSIIHTEFCGSKSERVAQLDRVVCPLRHHRCGFESHPALKL